MKAEMAPARAINRTAVLTLAATAKAKRIHSIDLLRGIVMIIMALDHVRDYFHADVFLYNPTNLSQTNISLFFTRWVTHFCAPVFIFLAGLSAYLYGAKKSKKELSFFLLTRGIWLVLAELFLVSLFHTFNPTYTYISLQVIWAIGVCMMALSLLIYLPRTAILAIGILLIAGHNLLDSFHVTSSNVLKFFWAVLHEPHRFQFRWITIGVNYPVLPWMGVLALGYCTGVLYTAAYTAEQRKKLLLLLGSGTIVLFIVLRWMNRYGDAAIWSPEANPVFSLLSFLNLTKYPPSLLYCLMTLGPALVFLAFAEMPLNGLTERVIIFGRVPMFFYLLHILVIHILASIAGVITGYYDIIVMHSSIVKTESLRGYGFNLATVYLVWIALILMLYPLCKRFDWYKRTFSSRYWWLRYL